MKKIIALLLALIMTFSMGTVAFAAGEDAGDPPVAEDTTNDGGEAEGSDEEAEDSPLGEYDWILDLPFGTVKPALKIAKIVLKLAKVYVKLGFVFGFIDKEAFMQQVYDFIGGLIGSEEIPGVEDILPDSGNSDDAAEFFALA